jgi:hypothetical protein
MLHRDVFGLPCWCFNAFSFAAVGRCFAALLCTQSPIKTNRVGGVSWMEQMLPLASCCLIF